MMFGILSFSSLLQATDITCSFKVSARSANSTGESANRLVTESVLGTLSLYDWINKEGSYERVTSLPEISSFMLGINLQLQDEFTEVIDKTTSSVQQIALDVQQGEYSIYVGYQQMYTMQQRTGKNKLPQS